MKNTTRHPLFNGLKKILRIFVRKPKVITTNMQLDKNAIYLSNHVGCIAPLKHELYFPHDFKFWGTYEMVFSVKDRWKYLSNTYFHQKRHFNKFISNILATILLPFLTIFYKGIQLIPTYTDSRLITTIKKSVEYLKKGKSIIIFPENSSDGYHSKLKSYFAGFIELAKYYYKKTGHNIKIYNMYFRKEDNKLIIEQPVSIKEIIETEKDIRIVANEFKDKANNLYLSNF